MQRNKNKMEEKVFKRSVNQIALTGCETLMLSPVVGDPLLDKKLPQRLRYIDAFSTIRKKQFFTNLIGLKLFTDKEVVGVLEKTDLIIISIAPNKIVYEKLFGVDKFNEVVQAIERICKLIPLCRKVPKIEFAGRTSGNFSVDSNLLKLIQKTGASGSTIWTSEYANWGGNLTGKKGIAIKHENRAGCSMIPCERALVPVIFYDGRVGLCACADYEAKFVIGDVNRQELSEILTNNRRVRLIRSFLNGSMPEYCAKCTFYVRDPNVDFWRSLEARGDPNGKRI
jgi:radical SAM protein with 4Fe4S-binding SPASM domain